MHAEVVEVDVASGRSVDGTDRIPIGSDGSPVP